MTRIKRILLSMMLALGLAGPAFIPAIAHAAELSKEGLRCGAELTFSTECPAADSNPSADVDSIIQTAIDIISIVVAIVAVIMIIIGGFRYITSSGESGAVTSAKNSILYAVIGLVVVALAQVVVRFVVGELSDETGGGGAPPQNGGVTEPGGLGGL